MANVGIKIAAVVVVVLIVAGGAYFLLGDAQDDNTTGDRTLTDLYGNEFKIPDNIDSVIAECGPALRYLSFMGEDVSKKVTATSSVNAAPVLSGISYTYLYGLGSLEQLGEFKTAVAMEKIVTRSPDLVIIGNMGDTYEDGLSDFISTMKAAGIPVCIIKYVYNLEDPAFAAQVKLMGDIFGCSERAQQLLDGIDQQVKTLEELCSKIDETANAYIGGVLSFGNADLLTSVNTESSAFAYLGNTVNNVAESDNVKGAPKRQWIIAKSDEALLRYDDKQTIDALFIDLGGYKKVLNNDTDLLNKLKAYPEATYITLPTVAFSTCYDNTLIDAYWTLYALYAEKYPELFKDINMEETAKGIWSLFLDCSPDDANQIYNGIMKSYNVNYLFGLFDGAAA